MFKAIFNPRYLDWQDIQSQGMPIDPLEMGKEYDVNHSKISGNLNIFQNGNIVGCFPADWFTF